MSGVPKLTAPCLRADIGRCRPQAKEGKGAHRGEGLRAHLLASLLSRSQPPIEEALSKIKHILRKIGARTKEALIEAMGRALAAVSAQDVCEGSSLAAATASRRSSYDRRCEQRGAKGPEALFIMVGREQIP
jgi:hypothetical protein